MTNFSKREVGLTLHLYSLYICNLSQMHRQEVCLGERCSKLSVLLPLTCTCNRMNSDLQPPPASGYVCVYFVDKKITSKSPPVH